jgi:type IV pilus assembly protein PilW
MKPVRSYRGNRGITLVEILISLTIGFVVLAAVIVSFVGSGQAGRFQSALTQMNQDAQIALNLLSREVQLAGYAAQSSIVNTTVPPANPNLVMQYHNLACGTGACALGDVTSNAAYIFGCDADSSAHAGPFVDPRAVPLVCQASGAVSNSSGFGVVYEADLKNTVPTGGGRPSDCLGYAITQTTGAANFYIARNRYFIDVGANGRPELYCASPAGPGGTTKQPLLENVEDMQIWYGLAANAITTAPATRQIVRYVKAGKDATTANTINAAVAGGNADEWDKVMSVRICVLLRSSDPVLTNEDVVNDLDCNSNAVVTNDKYLRRAYYTTATLRSKMAF